MVLDHPKRVLLLLSLAPPGPKLQLAALHRLCHALVQVIFSTISQADLPVEERSRRLSQAEVVLSGMANQPAGLQIMLRLLMDAALHSQYSVHLGGSNPDLEQEQQSPQQPQHDLQARGLLCHSTQHHLCLAKSPRSLLHGKISLRDCREDDLDQCVTEPV